MLYDFELSYNTMEKKSFVVEKMNLLLVKEK